jgi:hypothetical protein
MLTLKELPNDILYIILANTNIMCHVCQKKYNFNILFYKKQSKFYYCSKLCYEFM